MKKAIILLMLIVGMTFNLTAQCECINGGTNVVKYINVVPTYYSGAYINCYSNYPFSGYSMDLTDGKNYRLIMSPQSGSNICTYPTMIVQNYSAGSNNYTYDFVYDAANGYGFEFEFVFDEYVQPGQYQSFTFELKKKILGIYYTQHTFNVEIHAQCIESSTSVGYLTNYTHGVAKYERNNYLILNSPMTNYYSDGSYWFDAGNYVQFNPGFSTSNVGYYEAFIDGCGGAKSGIIDSENSFAEETDPDPKSVRWTIYPNPANDQLNVFTDLNANTTIQIVDGLGRIRITKSIENNQELVDISELEKGIYFIRTHSEHGSETIKFIKQ